MSISRTEVEIVVTGAVVAERQLKAVAGAEAYVGAAAASASPAISRLSQSMQDMTRSGMTYNSMTMTWEKQAKVVAAATTDVAKEASGAAKAFHAAGRGVEILMRAAYLLPGLGFAGILLLIGEAANGVFNAMTGAAGATDGATTALQMYAAQADDAADAVARLADEQARLAGTRIPGGLKGGGYAGQSTAMLRASNEEAAANAEIERLTRLRVEMERNPATAVLTSADEDRVRRLSEDAARLRANAGAGWKSGVGSTANLSYAERKAEESKAYEAAVTQARQDADALDRQAASIYNTQKLRVEQIDDLIASHQNRVDALTKDMDRMSGKVDESKDEPKAERKARAARRQLKEVGPAGSSVIPGFGAMGADSAYIEQASRERAARNVKDMDDAAAYRDRMLAGAQLGPFQAEDSKLPSILSLMTADDAERERFKADMELASSVTRETFAGMGENIGLANSMLSGLGHGFAQAAASTLLLGGSFKKAANEMLKGLAVQALGQVLWETAMGTASLGLAFIGHPGAAAAATAHFQAAGMFGAIAAGAALGAAGTGGLRGGGGGGGGGAGSGASAAAGTNPYGPSGGQQTQVVVYIGSEVVTRGVQTETRRQAMRGGITEGRMAMAS